jgi:osmotically-inducible protein OsmY
MKHDIFLTSLLAITLVGCQTTQSSTSTPSFTPNFDANGYSRAPKIQRTTDKSAEVEKSVAMQDARDSKTAVDFSAGLQIDRRTKEQLAADIAIEAALKRYLATRARADVDIQFLSFNRRVFLFGEVGSDSVKRDLLIFVSRLENVQLVVDETRVAKSSAPKNFKIDRVIAQRVQNFLKISNIFPGTVRVLVYGGEVALMGIVNNDEHIKSTDIASRTPGVSKVIAAFEIMSNSEIASIESSTPLNKKIKTYFEQEAKVESETKIRCKLSIRKTYMQTGESEEVSVDTLLTISQKGLIKTLTSSSNKVVGVINTTMWLPDGTQISAVDQSFENSIRIRNKVEDNTQTTTGWDIDRSTGLVSYFQSFSSSKGDVWDSGDGSCEKIDSAQRKF